MGKSKSSYDDQDGDMSHPGHQLASPVPSRGFTQAQLDVLRNQILAFRAIKNNESVSQEVLAGIKPPPLPKQQVPDFRHAATQRQQQPASRAFTSQGLPAYPGTQRPALPAAAMVGGRPAGAAYSMPLPSTSQALPRPVQPAQAVPDAVPAPPQGPHKGPLYAMSSGSRQPPPMTIGDGLLSHHRPPQQLGYSVAELLRQECSKKAYAAHTVRIAKLERLLASGTVPGYRQVGDKLGRAKLMLELRRLKARGLQEQMRNAIEKEQADINGMQDRVYRKFARNSLRIRIDQLRQEEKARGDAAVERVRMIKNWRTAQQERIIAEREMRTLRNRNAMKRHERLARGHHKLKDDDRTRRMDALKAHDFEAYQELLREQGGTDTSSERYEVISRFLNDTEEYLHRLAGKVASVKLAQEASEAAALAIAESRAQGLTEEEVSAAARNAAEEAAASSELVRQSKANHGDAQSRYYSLAHSVEETVRLQPNMLRPPGDAKLREYQLVGLQWMVSLYNNRLNGILADEMGLGKTVQVMALLAYLMEHKNVFGPHLIIVPNAVMVNWKSELTQWLPEVRCVYYVGQKEERARKFATEVQSLQFNVLVTTYEYIMRDRAKLCKVEWKYIIIDEAQRMKDRQSKLAKDLDRFVASRRLLLTGTPLQNELRELWSLLNLLLPEVFDDKSTFTEWFGDSLGKNAQGEGSEDEWLATEKRVVVIHRLHQILEPFMLRRQVEDVESKLPPKVPKVVKVAMPPYQAVIYNWVKRTGTIRNDPDAALPGKSFREFSSLNNKCMELRKVCNHPALSYPPNYIMDPEELVAQCGKFVVLDRMLVKLHASGHRVLLFSTMTRLLDLLEHYLRWRGVGTDGQQRMGFLRIDGSTSLEDREKAIQQFNRKDSECFIFLLSIRAAGRGLNLQSADTVVIYDPDPNPKNEEQAIARSHRIGQTKEVRVFHLEAVADAPADAAQAGQAQEGGKGTAEQKYADSIESLVRNTIQKLKIDMANEVIDAGRFDMRTTMEERKQTLETLLQDEERMKQAMNMVPSNEELNNMLARSPEEKALFDRMDREHAWPVIPTDLSRVPRWLIASEEDVARAIASSSKSRLSANAQMAADAARPQPMLKRKTVRVDYTAGEASDDEFVAGPPAVLGDWQRGSVEPMGLEGSREGGEDSVVDNDDMEEEVIDANIQQAPELSSLTGPLKTASVAELSSLGQSGEDKSGSLVLKGGQEEPVRKRLKLVVKVPSQKSNGT